ncbi:MAG: TRAP transporter small permease [Rhodobacteraceae bacterium]|nr:TRAP transporter small permease [Paracoccaceae bacterium]
MTSHARAAWRWVDEYAEYAVNTVLYSYIALIIAIEIFRRYVLDSSSSWGEETAIYAFIWMTYIGAARGVKNRSHLAIDIVKRCFNRTGTFAVNMLSDICFFTLAVVIIVMSIRAVEGSMQYQQTFQGADIPMWIAIVGVPISWSLIILRVTQRSIRTIRAYMRGEAEATGNAVSE